MTFVHTITLPSSQFSKYGIETSAPTATDRRGTVRMLYGDWFREHGLKLTRDYMVVFGTRTYVGYGHCDIEVKIEIKDPTKALLFKLTWGGKC